MFLCVCVCVYVIIKLNSLILCFWFTFITPFNLTLDLSI